MTPILSWTGGLQEYVAGMSHGLVDLGHEVIILTGGAEPTPGVPLHPLARDLDVRWHPREAVLGRYMYPSGMARSIRELSEWADIVHAYRPFTPSTAITAMRRVAMAFTPLLHPDHVMGRHSRLRRVAVGALLRRADLVVAVSEAELRLLRTIRAPRNDCVVWPGIETRPESEVTRTGKSRPLILCVANMNSPTKGIPLILKAFAALQAHHKNCDLRIVGQGRDQSSLRELCRELGLDADGILVGGLPEPELDQLYAEADVYISMSSQESFGISVMKAIAHSCRVVVSDIPSHREILTTLGVPADALLPIDSRPEVVASALAAQLTAEPVEHIGQSVPTWTDSASLLVTAYRRVLGSECSDANS